MNGENSIFSGMNGNSYRLGTQIGVGGEGTVYAVQGTQLVAKIYKQVNPEIEGKLRYMVYHQIPQAADQYGNLILRAAWPQDILYDGNRNFIGYVMPRIETGVELFQIQRGGTSGEVRSKFPNYTWRLNVLVARNLAVAVNVLHNQGYVLGDMNCKNFLVNTDGSVSLLDTDSIDMTDPNTGKHYKCCVGMEDYLPPELQGRNLRNPSSRFTKETDNFALAVHIFQLLMNNYHPFSARQTIVKGSSSANPKMDRIVEGKCPYLNTYADVTIPMGAPRLEDVLPQYMIDAFRNTFNYTGADALAKVQGRTTAVGWVTVLKQLLQECDEPGGLIRCRNDASHYYLRSKGYCGCCRVQRIPTPPAQHVPKPQPQLQSQVQPQVQPKFQPVGDYFADRGNEFYLTEEEARQGGTIAVYARGRKEFQQLPPYNEIGSKYRNIHIGTGALFNKKLHKCSDGRLNQWSPLKEFKTVISMILMMLLVCFAVATIVSCGYQTLDWVLEGIAGIDLIKSYSIAYQFRYLCIDYPPFGIYPFQLQVSMTAPNNLLDWILIVVFWIGPVGMTVYGLKDYFDEMGALRDERSRRRKM